MLPIPALLYITRPQIRSIDPKGRATMKIRILSMIAPQKFGYIVSATYKKYTEDQLILVNPSDDLTMFSLVQIVGPTSLLDHWNTILPFRIQINSKDIGKKFLNLPNYLEKSLDPQISHGAALSTRKFLLSDTHQTTDREDGIWYDSPTKYGIFAIDLPS